MSYFQKLRSWGLVERSDAVDNPRRIRPALAYNQRSVELAGGQDADEIEELKLVPL